MSKMGVIGSLVRVLWGNTAFELEETLRNAAVNSRCSNEWSKHRKQDDASVENFVDGYSETEDCDRRYVYAGERSDGDSGVDEECDDMVGADEDDDGDAIAEDEERRARQEAADKKAQVRADVCLFNAFAYVFDYVLEG
jgi:hypothetical protein